MNRIKTIINEDTLYALKQTLRLGLIKIPQTSVVHSKDFILQKIYNVNAFYKRVTGIDELDRYQDRVTDLQEQLLTAQETRRQIGYELANVRKQSNAIQDQLHKVKRNENFDIFLNLMKEETGLLKREQEISRNFYEQDRVEREIFTAFTNAIRDSHEKQRTRLEYTKYLGIILSILGSFISFLIANMRTEDLKNIIKAEMGVHSAPILKKLDENEKGILEVVAPTLKQLRDSQENIKAYLNEEMNNGGNSSMEDFKSILQNMEKSKSEEKEIKEIKQDREIPAFAYLIVGVCATFMLKNLIS